MKRSQLLAAEIFGYSFANYDDHLGIGNIRFEKLMPAEVETLEEADRDAWPVPKLAGALQISDDEAIGLLESLRNARQVVDAENPAQAFRNGVRISIRRARDAGLDGEEAVEELVTQICYRAADLAFLLDMRGDKLSRYSRQLRREPGDDFYDGDFDESV